MNKMTQAVLISLTWMTDHFSAIEEDLGRPPEGYSIELKAALAQREMLEKGLIEVTQT